MEMNEIKEMAEFLSKNKITTHIDTKDNSFYNGIIIEIHETFLVMHDRVLGETAIAFSEIEKMNKFKEVGG